jgi:nucleotide-binding universal stress UspA family protein
MTETNVFARVVCGVDGSEAGVTAARAAARVADPDGSLTLVTANDRSAAVHGGFAMAQILERLAREAAEARDRGRDAVRALHDAEAKVVDADPLQALLAEIEKTEATLAVVGSHGFSRPLGIALGSVATYLLHKSPCPVLLVRGDVSPAEWPRRIVVGVDGSEDSARAYATARELADRVGSALRAVVATQDKRVDLDAARSIAPDVEEQDARAVDFLNVASETADLVIVGSRGVQGLKALGSVGERVAHEARSSVLVVRGRA